MRIQLAPRRNRFEFIVSIALIASPVFVTPVLGDAIERLQIERLRAVHDAVAELHNSRKQLEPLDEYDDFRALLHVHSHLSHDSRGTIAQIIAAAHATGVRVILFSEHPADHYDYYADGHSGLHDGVLMIPGAETGGFLAYPTRSLGNEKIRNPQQFADLIRQDDGLIFLSHLEERMDWEIAGLTGTEIYNTHADFKDEKNFVASLRNPLTLFSLLPVMAQFPQESFAALQDYPADYLKRWDTLGQKSRLTGVAANDSHQNQAVVVRLLDSGRAALEDALGKKISEIDPAKIAGLSDRIKDKRPGDVIFEQYLDRYENSFRHVSTHLLMKQLDRDHVWDALKHGRAYVAFDWIADPTGFRFDATCDGERYAMGSEIAQPKVTLRTRSPLDATTRIIRNGTLVTESKSRELTVDAERPGIYRVEVWVNVAGELRPWILSNPIYLREP